MTTKTVSLAAVLLGIGCSHATPKTESPAALASASRPSIPSTRREQPTANANRDDSGANAIFFDLDSSAIRRDARTTLQRIGEEVARSKKSIRIEGNCDERGTTEYNIALGDRRAREAEKYLERLGVPEKKISIVSYGSERPKDPGHDENAWAQNRRDDLKLR